MSRFEYLVRRRLDPGVLLIAVGTAGMFVSALADSIGVGRPGFGTEQLSGLIISALVALAGVMKVLFADARKLARVLTGVYVSGILYVGLKPNFCKAAESKILLSVRGFTWHDFALNVGGFVLLGYLLLLSFEVRQKDQREGSLIKRAILAAAVGGLISLFLEVSQYYLIPGRSSSLFDFIANSLGGLVGITLYLIPEHMKNRHND